MNQDILEITTRARIMTMIVKGNLRSITHIVNILSLTLPVIFMMHSIDDDLFIWATPVRFF